jgi:hypothetical protein
MAAPVPDIMDNSIIFSFRCYIETTSVVQWSDFIAADPEVPGSIPGATRFSE